MRISTPLSAVALAAALCATFGAQAQSIDLKVIGTIAPAACVPSMTGGGIVNYGKIATSSVNLTTTTAIGAKEIPFTITCDALTRIGIKAVDNQAATRVAGILPGIGDEYNFALGAVSTANVGGYMINVKQSTFTADGVSAFSIVSSNNGTSWAGSATPIMSRNANSINSWSRTNGGAPLAFRTITGTLEVTTYLNRGDALPLTSEVPLDGSATIELVYL